MNGFVKFIMIFLMYGVLWFGLFSITVNNTDNVFVVLQKALKLIGGKEALERTEKPIQSQKVIDALTNAFKP